MHTSAQQRLPGNGHDLSRLWRRIGSDIGIEQFRQYRARWVEIGLGSVLINLIGLAAPLYSMQIYDKVIGNTIVQTLYALLLGMLLFIALDFLLKLIRAHYVEQIAIRADREVDGEVAAALLQTRSARVLNLGELMARYRDLTASREILSSHTLLALADMPFLALYLLVLAVVGGWLVLVPTLLGALLLASHWMLRRPISRHARTARKLEAGRLAMLAELAGQAEQIRSSRWRVSYQQAWSDLTDRVATQKGRERFWTALHHALIGDATLLIWVVTLFFGALLADHRQLTVGALTACSLLASRSSALLGSAGILLERYEVFVRARVEFDAVLPDAQTPSETLPDRGLRGRFVLDSVSLAYGADRPSALRNISLSIEPGERVGVVGRNGSGKSTLLKCLAGAIAPSLGRLLLDGANLHAYSIESLTKLIGYKQQDAHLFQGSLDYNLRGASGVEEADLHQALYVTGLDQMLGAGSLALDMPIAAQGGNLSGGQRQAIALARTLAEKPGILILDEPTAGLDQDAEAQFCKRLLDHIGSRTLIVSSHSLPLLRQMDRIIVMQDGAILADGPREKVLVN